MPHEQKCGLARRELIAGAAAAAALTCFKASRVLAENPVDERSDENETAGDSSGETIYTGVSLEFVQLWDHLTRIKQAKELGLGNLVILASTFHLGNDDDRRRWKERYPALAAQIDKVPRTQTLREVGAAAILQLPDDILLEEAKLCRDNGLYIGTASYLTACQGADCTGFFARLKEIAGTYWLSHSLQSEHTSVLSHGRSAEMWKRKDGVDPRTMNLQDIRAWYVNRDRQAVQAAHGAGVQMTDNVEATAQFRIALAAGVKCPILELVPYEPLSGLAAVRGAAKAYASPWWGVCFASGYYRPPVDASVPNRTRIAYNLFYAGGARLFYDVNDYFHIYSLGAGWFEDPRPPARMGEKEFRGFDDPICVAQRKVLQDHYRFVQFHDRPKGGPRVKLGFLLGHLDSYTGFITQSHVWGVDEPGWEAGDAEFTWQHFRRLYEVEPWYTPSLKGYWQNDPVKTVAYGTPPCGQVDIVPMEAPFEVLQTYSCLICLGWNTMDQETYAKLKDYVHAGGRLLMSVPQFSTQTDRKSELKLIQGGDYQDLFGAKIIGVGEKSRRVEFIADSELSAYQFPRGSSYETSIGLAKAEIVSARVLAASPKGSAVLLENRFGKGFTWLITTWSYPAPLPGHFMTDVLQTISNGEQDAITVQGDSLYYAVYGFDGKTSDTPAVIYLVNRNPYGIPEYGRVARDGKAMLIRVDGYEMRIVWNYAGLMFSPFDRYVKVVAAQSTGDGYELDLVSEKGSHRIQLACLGRRIDRVLLQDAAQQLHDEPEGSISFQTVMAGRQKLTVYLQKT